MPRKARNQITQQFAWRTIPMLESPAYRVLSLSAHRVLARLEIEFAKHGGRDSENGKLPCTYQDFIDYGVHKDAVAPAIREVIALGFVQLTEQGIRGDEKNRRPNKFRLCYRHWNGQQPTDEWRRIKTIQEAEKAAADARADAKCSSRLRRKPVRRSSLKVVVNEPAEAA
jgi:hypothetical protein